MRFLDHYQRESKKTELCGSLPYYARAMYHAAKIVEEYQEIEVARREFGTQSAESREEIGDLFWHIAGFCRVFGWSIRDIWRLGLYPPKGNDDLEAQRAAVEVLSKVAKTFGQGREFETEEIQRRLGFLALRAVFDFEKPESELEKILRENLRKLEKRYLDSEDKIEDAKARISAMVG